jgi:hypothetical protein
MNKGNKYKDTDRVSVDYKRIIKKANKLGFTPADVSLKIGKSRGYIMAMSGKSSKMLYRDLKLVARLLGIHGASQLVAVDDEDTAIDKDILEDMKADTPTDERIATALETIATCLQRMDSRF